MNSTIHRGARRATIVGAGQGGLHLAHGLLGNGWEVTLLADKTPAEQLAGPMGASHTLQGRSTAMEAAAGAAPYEGLTANPAVGVDFALSLDGERIDLGFVGDFERPATAIDLRLKYALLTERFAARGGRVVHRTATLADLEELTERGEHVFLATGKGELSGLFELDEERTVFDRPQRRLMIVLADGMTVRHAEQQQRIPFCFRPGLGEIFLGPNLHKDDRPVRGVLIEAVPGSEMDRLDEVVDAASALAIAKQTVERFAPWEAASVAGMRLTDDRAFLRGALRPCVRRPVATLPSGRAVFGLGDVTIVNDPVAGQGGNCTVHGVHSLLAALREEGDGVAPTADWYQAWFDRFWEREGRFFVAFSNMLLEAPGEPAQVMLGAASRSRAVADRFGSTFAQPEVLVRYGATAALAERFVAEAEEGLRAEISPAAAAEMGLTAAAR